MDLNGFCQIFQMHRLSSAYINFTDYSSTTFWLTGENNGKRLFAFESYNFDFYLSIVSIFPILMF